VAILLMCETGRAEQIESAGFWMNTGSAGIQIAMMTARSLAIHPVAVSEIPLRFWNAYGAVVDGKNILGRFSLDILSGKYDAHVVYDKPTDHQMPRCQDCNAKLDIGDLVDGDRNSLRELGMRPR
jgi:hypothetical protein